MGSAIMPDNEDEMLDDYDFSSGIRGKYVDRLKKGSNLMVIDPEVSQPSGSDPRAGSALRI